jgi:hypothetical protein
LQGDVEKYISVSPSPAQLVGQAQGKGKNMVKEHHVVGEGDNVVVIGDSSDDEDEETLQQ